MLFKEVAGHLKIKSQLTDSYKAGRTAHAQIFLGKEGNGSLALAMAYAQFLLCEDQQAEDSCGQCNSCRKTQKLVHPDIHFSYPTVGPKKISTDFIKEWRETLLENPYMNINQWLQKLEADNKQGNITVSECLSIVQRLSYKAMEGRYRIMILWLPEYLGKEGNRLLKLIEEPRPNTVFLLVSENPDKILNTILSRCQLVSIPRLKDEEIASILIEKHKLDSDSANSLAYLSEGNYNKAISQIKETTDNNALIFIDWLRVCYLGKPKDMVHWVEGIVSGKHKEKDFFNKTGRKDQVYFLQYGLYFLKEFLSLQQGRDQIRIRFQKTELSTATNMLKVIGVEQIGKMMHLFDETSYHIERNGNPRILFLDASIQMNHLLKKKTIGFCH